MKQVRNSGGGLLTDSVRIVLLKKLEGRAVVGERWKPFDRSRRKERQYPRERLLLILSKNDLMGLMDSPRLGPDERYPGGAAYLEG